MLIVAKAFSLNVVSTRTSTQATGTIQVKLGFVQPPNAPTSRSFSDIYADFLKLSRPSLVSAPPVRHPHDHAFNYTFALTTAR